MWLFQSKAVAGEAADARVRAVLHEVRLPFARFVDSCCTLERGRYVTLGDLVTAFGAFLRGWPIHDPLTARFADRPHLIASATVIRLIDELSATAEGGGMGLARAVVYSQGTVSIARELGGGQTGVDTTRFMITGLSLDRVLNWAEVAPRIHPPASLAEVFLAVDPETAARRLRVREDFDRMRGELAAVTARAKAAAAGAAATAAEAIAAL